VEEVAQGGAQELTAALVAIAFAAPPDETEAAATADLRRKRATLLLDKMAARLMDRILEAGCGAARLGCAGSSVQPADAAATWALHAIRFLTLNYNRYSGTNKKNMFFKKSFPAYYFLKVHVLLHHFSNIKSQKEVTKQKKSRFFILYLLNNRRIRIRIQEAQKHVDPDSDPDSEHCFD
jgi:hypothetical protein